MTSRLAALAVVLSLWHLPAFADDAGLDWRPIPASESKVRITLRDAAADARYFRTETDGYEANLYFARVPTSDYRLDRIFVLYAELAPGRYFPVEYDVTRVLAWKELRASGASRTDSFTLVTRPGAYDVITFTAEGDVACAAFSITWGNVSSDTSGAGSRRIFGYGCEERGKPLGRARIKEALDSLEVAD